MNKKWKLVTLVLGLTAFGVFVARMSNSVHVLAQQTAYTQTITNQYGTYTNAVIVGYDPLAGSGDGEAYVTEQLTGRPSNFMPTWVNHTPSGNVQLNGHGYTQTGNPVPANQSPNFTRTWSFDIFGDCDQQLLDNGFCTGDGQVGDLCPISAGLFINFLHGMEFEIAITDWLVPAHSTVGTKDVCTPESSPPDGVWLFKAPATADVDLTYRAQTGCYRFCPNPPCTGQVWTCPGATKKSKTIPNTPLLNCTNKDKGFITGQNVTY